MREEEGGSAGCAREEGEAGSSGPKSRARGLPRRICLLLSM